MRDGIPQLKAVFIKVGKLFHVTDKAVESAIIRAIHSLYCDSAEKIPTCKEWISALANSIWFEEQNENRGDSDANEKEHAG